MSDTPASSPGMDAATLKPCPFASPEQRRWTHRSWESMKARCLNPRHPHYRDYGGRGIVIHEPWRESFDAFARDVGPRPSKDVFLDRIDNNGSYVPGNVRWATRKQQHRNKRNNHHITANGVTRTLAEWAEVSGIRKQTIRRRLKAGWSPETALSEAPSYDGTRHMTREQTAARIKKMTETRYGRAS